jgi:glycosyltransferase involved in cell wall biosynthesis
MKKNIAFYINMFLMGGVETSLLEYIRVYSANDYTVTLVIGVKMYEHEILLDQIPKHIKIIYILKDSLLSRFLYLKHSNRVTTIDQVIDALLISIVRKFYLSYKTIKLLKDYDCVVDYALALKKVMHKLKITKIGFFHFNLKNYYLNDPKKINTLKSKLEYYNYIIVISQKMLQDAKNYFPLYINKFVLIYNQLSFNRIIALANQKNSNSLLQNKYIVSVSRLDEKAKDLTSLVYAYAILNNKFHRTEKLIIIGEGEDRSKLQELINQLNLSQHIYLLGYQVNPFPWILAAQLFILSSKSEGFGIALVEAMVLGKPVISTDCPDGPREILLDGKCGILVPVGDTEQLASAMNKILSNIKIANQITNEANKHLYRFDIYQNLTKLYELLN